MLGIGEGQGPGGVEVVRDCLLGLLDSLGLVLGMYIRKGREFLKPGGGASGGDSGCSGEVMREIGDESFGKGHGKNFPRNLGVRALREENQLRTFPFWIEKFLTAIPDGSLIYTKMSLLSFFFLVFSSRVCEFNQKGVSFHFLLYYSQFLLSFFFHFPYFKPKFMCKNINLLDNP